MSDVPESVANIAAVAQPVAESSGSVWGYVAGGVVLLIIAGIYGYKKINQPAFVIKQVRKKNLKEMKKQGIENSEFMVDMDKLLESMLAYTTENKMKGADVVTLLKPLNDKDRVKTPKDMYNSMIYIANEIKDVSLAKEFKNKSKQVKSSSALMAGLLKRAGI
ncbi:MULTISPECIES: hypothetical protein [Photobacterium]|uniref:Uncharacterized protein n=2 Tax=Photobacterium angustum TaxID=661 RepID=A0A0D8NPI5_PHOAN|nr:MULTISPECIES: hypothetical protein [Photobacterium]KJF82817.1 hypothetical protein UB36_05025 [Photobacterium damselae subsp. damselae]EAS64072.1 hypothetical protein VAS14_17501 [Photobacterium angustum S14]KJF96453.1 hypothetical protein UB39_00545 [Photobacterium angustum]KJG03681.1 hypothetical protein UB35_02550 [Photobacterium angustum]KJG07492.1 hypothetical protein UB33_04265 [Photobacterium angustum]